jgi:ribonuclease J
MVMTSVTVYDGAQTIGGNKIYVEENGCGLFLDFGMNFSRYGQYFQEFLSERTGRGIHDLLYLGLIPGLNVYRSDLLPADVSLASHPTLNVKGVLLSHAHLDHCGNIGLLRQDIPVITSTTTVAILKALRDTSPAHLGAEISYHSPKEPLAATEGLVLRSPSSGSYVSRDFFCLSEPSQGLKEFASARPGQDSARKKMEPGRLCHIDELPLDFEIRAYEVDHSIFGSNAYILKGDTTIAYTGDFRLHGKKGEKTKEFVHAAKDAPVLIIEGTRVGRESQSDVTEREVFEKCYEVTQESKNLTVADFSARNFERLYTFLEIAEKTGKELVVTAKDAYMLHALGCVEGKCLLDNVDRIRIYSELKDRDKIKWESEVVVGNWNQRYLKHTEIAERPEKFIMCLSFLDLKHLLDIKPSGGAYIYSSSEAFTEEDAIDFVRLARWLNFFNMGTYGFKIVGTGEEARPEFVKGFHSSGHASTNDLEQVISDIDPDVVIPVHTSNPEWFRKFDKAVLLAEGEKYVL